MKPYHQDDGVTIYNEEALSVLPHLAEVGAVITDPPYSSGGQFRGDRTSSTLDKYVRSDTYSYRPEFAGDSRDQRSYFAWLSLVMAGALAACDTGAVCAVFTDWRQLPTTTDAIQAGGWVWRGVAVWDKTEGARPRRGAFTSQCEYIVWGTAGPLDADRNEVYLPGVFTKSSPRDKKHIAQKPEGVMRWVCRYAPPDSTILDPFMGSGTTLRAARDLGRDVIGIDVDERYCGLAVDRLQQRAFDLEGAA